MTTATFDALGYFEKLKAAGVPEAQARVQADAFRAYSTMQDEKSKQELATKGDIREMELKLQKEIEKVRAEVKETEARLLTELVKVKYDMLKWQLGIGLALTAIMAKGFNWIGF